MNDARQWAKAAGMLGLLLVATNVVWVLYAIGSTMQHDEDTRRHIDRERMLGAALETAMRGRPLEGPYEGLASPFEGASKGLASSFQGHVQPKTPVGLRFPATLTQTCPQAERRSAE